MPLDHGLPDRQSATRSPSLLGAPTPARTRLRRIKPPANQQRRGVSEVAVISRASVHTRGSRRLPGL